MKKYLIYSAVVIGLSAILGITSRLSVGFSEWYAVKIYPIFIGTIGRFFSLFPFSVAEILVVLLIVGGFAGIVFFIVKIKNSKGNRRKTLAVFRTVTLSAAAALSTILLLYILNCGINYNRYTFLDESYVNPNSLNEEEGTRSKTMIFLSILEEFYEIYPQVQDQIDEDGVFSLKGNLHKTAPEAMNKLSKAFPRLNVYHPRPKPLLFSGLVSDAFVLGFFFPYTFEANYNRIVPDSCKPSTALHELAHSAGFMREEEAGFIAFMAARESGNPELMYCGYLEVLMESAPGLVSKREYDSFPKNYRDLIDLFMEKCGIDWQKDESDTWKYIDTWPKWQKGELYINLNDLIPIQVRGEYDRQNNFFWERKFNTQYIYDDEGEVIDVIISADPLVEAISEVSSDINDNYLKIQGQEDGIESYWRTTDLVYAFYANELELFS